MGLDRGRLTGFPPIADASTRVLILGSLPGEASLAAGQYYGHPRNDFWRLIGPVIGRDLVPMAYADRLQALAESHIGLWDVIASAERRGSLDSAIRLPQAADLRGLVSRLPALRAIAFNGAKASALGRRILDPVPSCVVLMTLPSSSPAHARPLAEKARSWGALTGFLTG
ncbi:DNA-deoxyinosine glycosylase [Brevundimonas sp.]|uniref:DNA-deoxyinosine glycosylase n=1 Tax=Brevundimonas sp. TaxID=1871086 RepID=UPI002ABC2B1C|nr:DNA-deoxyinosine glycosylase [Brevundimonas sp.]MDZ4362537.1 DNA-deoxyinosine glycosylase [Brevundimonas sp.]